jgi:hypothetical protein
MRMISGIRGWMRLMIFVSIGIAGIAAAQSVVPSSSPATATSQPAVGELEHLRTENAQLREQLRLTQERLDDRQKWLNAYAEEKRTRLEKEQGPLHKEQPATTNPVTSDAGRGIMMWALIHSRSQLKTIGQALQLYANTHGGKGPATLEDLRRAADIPTLTFQSPLLNCRYKYVRYATNMQRLEVVAYEESDYADRSILFADGTTQGFPAAEADVIVSNGRATEEQRR